MCWINVPQRDIFAWNWALVVADSKHRDLVYINGGTILPSKDPLIPRNSIKGADICIFTWLISYLWLIHVWPRHLGKWLVSRPYQHDAISVMEHCSGKGKVPVSQVVARSRTAKVICIFKQDSNGVLLPCQVKMNCFWCSLFIKIKEKMNFLDQSVHIKCQELDEFALARRPFLEQHLQLESSFFKVYNNPKTSWCFAWVKLNCGRNHYGFTLKADSNTNFYNSLMNTVSLLTYHLCGGGDSNGLCLLCPTIVTLTPLIRAFVGVIPVSKYIHFNCTL